MRTGNIEIAGSKLGIHSLEAGDISALGVVAVGTTVYNTSYGVIQWYNGTSWVTPTHTVTGSGGDLRSQPGPGFLCSSKSAPRTPAIILCYQAQPG